MSVLLTEVPTKNWIWQDLGSRGFFFFFEDLMKTTVYQFRGFKRCKILFAPEQPRDRQDDVEFDKPIWSQLIDDNFLMFFE